MAESPAQATTVSKLNNANQNKQPATEVKQPAAPKANTDVQNTKSGDTITVDPSKLGSPLTKNEVAESKPAAAPTYTEAQIRHAFDLDKPDLSDAQLKALGIDRNTYIRNGVKYIVTGSFDAYLDNGQKFYHLPFHVTHNADGSFHNLFYDNDYSLNIPNMGVNTYGFNYAYAPLIQGGTIYIHQGHQLTSEDARAGLPDQYAAGYEKLQWDLSSDVSNVNIDKPGKYHAAVDVTYKNQLGVSTNINVIVIGPTGKDHITTPINVVPDPGQVITNDGDLQSHFPGTTYSWEVTPKVSAPSDGEPATVVVTWPDKTTTEVPTKIIIKDTTEPTTETEVVKRDIYTQLEGQQPVKVDTQRVTLTRNGQKDTYTHKVTWGAWSTGTIPAYTAPTIPNYTVTNPNEGAAVAVDGSQTQLADVVFKYKANHKTITTGQGTTEDVKRDIYTKLGDQAATKYDTQTITLHRQGDENLATGVITWGAWTSAQMPAYAAPLITNWTVTNPDAGAAVTADGSQTELADVVFNYTANHRTITTGQGTTEDVSRDIYTKLGDQTATKYDTQTITLHRQGDEDLTTGKITWGAWTPAQMPAYTAPTVTNWTVTNPDAGAAVTADGSKTKLADVVFNYQAGHRTITTGEGTTKNVTRDIYTKLGDQAATKYDTQTVTLHRQGDENLATGAITWGAWSTATIPTYAAPDIANYDVINPNAGAAVTVDGSKDKAADVIFNYKAETAQVIYGAGTTKNVSRNIYTQIGSQPKELDYPETITLHRTGTRNLATGEITWNAWQAATVPAVSAPAITGYTVTNPDAGAAVTADGSQDQLADVVFHYKANAEEQVVNYEYIVDHSIVKTDKVDGTNGQTVHYTAQAPTNYVIMSGQSIPTSFTFGTESPAPITIWVDHAKQNVTDGTTKTITRKVDYINPISGATDVVNDQSVTLHRSAEKDLVTDQIVYGDWNQGQFDEVDAPIIPGYRVIGSGVAPVMVVNSDTQNSEVTFKYQPNLNNQVINYVDNSDKTTVVKSDNITGLTNSTVQYNAQAQVPYGWEIVPGQNVPTSFHFGTQDGKPVTIYIQHKIENVGDVTEDVTRQIFTNIEGQGLNNIGQQTVTLHRSETMDMVTYQVTYGAWQSAQMPAYTAPTIPNYTVTNPDAGAAVTADGSTTTLPSVIFNYKANHKTITSGQGTTEDVTRDIYTKLGDQAATKHDTQTVTLHRTGDENMATGQIVWGAWQSAQMPAYAAPSITNWTVTNPNAGAAVTVDGSQTKLADVVFDYTANTTTITTGEGTTENVSRDIYTNVEGQGRQKVDTETVTLHRTGTRNNATGAIAWNAWQTGTLEAVTAPSVPGYTVTNPDAGKAVTVDGSKTKVADVVFDYTANNHSTSVNYTNNGKTIYTYTVNGKTGQTVDTNITSNVPTGWEIVPGTTIPTTITYGTSGNDQPINVPIQHKVDTITTGDGTSKTITRVIETQIGDQAAQNAGQQTATIHRVGHYDEVTKQTTWDAWQTVQLPAFTAPTIQGYNVTNPDAAPAITIDGNSTDSTVVFHYVAADHSTQISYTNNGKTIYTYTVNGKTGQTVDTNIATNVPTGWEIVPGTTYPTTITYGTSGNDQPISVPIQHKVDTITTGDGTSKTITRTIEIQLGNGPVQSAGQQTATIHRVGHHDEVTGVTTWDAWQTAQLPAFSAPTEAGYTVVNPEAAPAITVDGNSTNSTVVFRYNANEETSHVRYVDQKTNQVVVTVPVNGTVGQNVNFDVTAHVPAGYKLAADQPTSIDFHFGTTTPADQTVYIVSNQAGLYQVTANGSVDTHVGATPNVPSMNVNNIPLAWTNNSGAAVSAPSGVTLSWLTAPDTSVANAHAQGIMRITFSDGSTLDVTVPAVVEGAVAGPKQKVNQGDPAPAAATTVDTTGVNHFGITNVTWATSPSTTVAGANVPGVAQVNYSDGTSQLVNVTIDVLKVDKGQDHHDDKDIYKEALGYYFVTDTEGQMHRVRGYREYARTRITDLALPEGTPGRVTYTAWKQIGVRPA